MPRLSLCVIARDESAMLPDCLASVEGVVDEIVLVDTGSIDDTVAIAKEHGATIVNFRWRDDFAAARNAALESVTGDWILVLDADERLGPGAGQAIQAAIQSSIDCGMLPLHDASSLDADPAEVVAGTARLRDPVLLPRLLRRTPDLAWEGVVHESVGAWLSRGDRTVEEIDAPIVHLGGVPEYRVSQGKYARNRRLLERRCELEPNNPVPRTYLVRELIRATDPMRARSQATLGWASLRAARAAGESPPVVDLASYRVHMLLEDGRLAEADSVLDEAAGWGISHPNLDLLRGVARVRLGDLPAAEKSFRTALARDGEVHTSELVPGATSWAASTQLGRVLLDTGRPTEALAAFDAALAAAPDNEEARLGRVEALLSEHPHQAFQELEPLLGDKVDPWVLAVACVDALGQAEDRRSFLKATSKIGIPARALRPRLIALQASDALTEPLAHLRMPLVNGPNAEALVTEGERRAQVGEAPEAFGCWLAALRRDPLCADAWIDLAAGLTAIERRTDAIALLLQALRVLPNHAEILGNLAYLYTDSGQPAEAARTARKLLATSPEHPIGVEVLGELDVHGAGGPVVADPRIEPLLGGDPLISVIVPTYGRPDALIDLLDRMSLQDLDRRAFEVIVVDDGSPEPVADVGPRPFTLKMLRQENAGPAAARNRALAEARGRYVLIYNDDALPQPSGVRQHLQAQLDTVVPEAVLGTFDFLPELLDDGITEICQTTNLMFSFNTMTSGERYGWTQFWTCNISLPRESIEMVGGFDTDFPRALVEDVELGYRLDQTLKLAVRYRPEIEAGHNHLLTWEGWQNRNVHLGRELWRMYEKHQDTTIIGLGSRAMTIEPGMLKLRARQESITTLMGRLGHSAGTVLRWGPPTPGPKRDKLMSTLRAVAIHQAELGIIQAACGFSSDTRPHPTPRPARTSVIIPNLNGASHLVNCLESLRTHTTVPVELIVVDNGSTDGSLEWLKQQPDVRLLEMGENVGAPAARNRGLAVASGERVLFCDNDVVFTPRWHEILVGHLEAWPDIGMVGPVSDYVVDAQKSVQQPVIGGDLDLFATELHEQERGMHAYAPQLILFFILARRELIEQIGGIDERYGRWGWEDNDWSLRAQLAGWKLRIARDCFIRHLGSQTSKSANIDYTQLLLENWEVFKSRWGIDPSLPYGSEYNVAEILGRSFDPAEHYVPFR